jgi:hypothetical protein
MILREEQATDGNRLTLDDLFRRAGVRHADALALVDPPNAAQITGRPPRRLTYAEADRAISALAARLRSFGLQTDTVVALQLANTVDSVIALFGVLRAGMIAAPLPLLWRRQEMVDALSPIGAKAIIVSGRIGAHAAAETAMQAAAELFPIRYVCGFGSNLPDGVVPLDDCIDGMSKDFFQPATRPGQAGAHVAAMTFDIGGQRLAPLPRSHGELIAAGLAVFREADLDHDATMLSTIPLGSFAGIAGVLLPWLLGGGTLVLHHGFDATVFAEQVSAHRPAAVVLPGPALTPLADAGLLGGDVKTIFSLWRVPEQLAAAARWQGEAAMVDIASFGDATLVAARRGTDGAPGPLPPNAPHSNGQTAVGFYRFRQSEIDATLTAIDPSAVIAALPDALLGERLAGRARDSAVITAALEARGANALIAAAFRPRGIAT